MSGGVERSQAHLPTYLDGGSRPRFDATLHDHVPSLPNQLPLSAMLTPLTPDRSDSIMNDPTPRPKALTIPVRVQPFYPSNPSACHRLWPVVVLVLVFGLSGEAGAASVSDGAGFDSTAHALACHCGPKCRGASCCCGSPAPVVPPKAKAPAAGAPKGTSLDNPCLSSAPCHDPLLPPSTPVGSTEKAAASRSLESPPARIGRRLSPPRSSRVPSDRRASRLDRPPKALATA